MEIKADAASMSTRGVGAAIIGERNKLSEELSEINKTRKILVEQIEKDRMRLVIEQRKKEEDERLRTEKLNEAEKKKIEAEEEAARRKLAKKEEEMQKMLESKGLRNRRESRFAIETKKDEIAKFTRVCSLGDSKDARKPRSIMKLKRLTVHEMDSLMNRSTEPKRDKLWWLEESRKREVQRQETEAKQNLAKVNAMANK